MRILKIYSTFVHLWQNHIFVALMSYKEVQIEESWKKILREEFEKEYFIQLKKELKAYKKAGQMIYPPGPMIFHAFDLTPFDKVKVVIIGQDPYHSPGQAMGLCFSVPKGVKIPASLRNIYKELYQDVGAKIPHHGDLSSWATQGVLLLNSVLTVTHKKPGSHKNIGWQNFTNRVIQTLSEKKENLVFLLWGNYAKSKGKLIDQERHAVLTSPHPSPLAGNGFFGNRHFSRTNELLTRHGHEPINWQIV